jgi:type II secretory pathway pseudopilin PulG
MTKCDTHPRQRRRRGFLLIDAVVAMGIILLLTLVLTVAVTRQQRTTAKLADTRDAVRLAEQTLTALQAGEPAPAPPEGSVIDILPAGPVKEAAGLAWVTVRVTHHGRSATLVGLARAAAAPSTAPATKEAAK